MLYAIIFVIVLIIIFAVFVIRKAQYAQRQRQAARSVLPTTSSDLYPAGEGLATRDIGAPVTFRGVARSVTNTMFPHSPQQQHMYDGDSANVPFNRRSMASDMTGNISGGRAYAYTGRGVERERAGESDPELPSYGDTRGTLPLRPAPTYDPAAARLRHEISSSAFEAVPFGDAPPKYALSTPGSR